MHHSDSKRFQLVFPEISTN